MAYTPSYGHRVLSLLYISVPLLEIHHEQN